jgi:VWFA-related protein
MYLDVEVRDADGNPIPGLTEDDFELWLNIRDWPIYSVDDLCACDRQGLPATELARAGEVASTLPESRHEEMSEAPLPAEEPSSEPGPATRQASQFVFYFDFSQLQMGGRENALVAARRWIRETMRPGDLVMLAAYADRSGVRTLCPFTDSPDRLLAALAAATDDPEFIDIFPSNFYRRIDECLDCMERCARSPIICPNVPCEICCLECRANALQEYIHGHRALTALQRFLQRLADTPGSKTLFLFHQNGVLFPGEFYPVIPNSIHEIGSHLRLLEEVGAEATEARARVYPIQTASLHQGQLMEAAANLSANLADYTGGRHNRSPADLSDVLVDAALACHCTYRIAFEPPEETGNRIYRARVYVRDSRLPYSYRVRHLTAPERTLRKAVMALDRPELAEELAMSAFLLPLSATDRRWRAAVQVALDIDRLRLLPLAEREIGELDVGVLLYREDGRGSWEMLTGDKVGKPSGRQVGGSILHQRVFDDLRPGRYQLRAFARHRNLELFGAAAATLELPAAQKGGIAGPVALCADRQRFVLPLPLAKEQLPDEAPVPQLTRGSVPATSDAVPRGELLEMVTWVCPPGRFEPDPAEPAAGMELIRYVARDGDPAFRLPDPEVEAAGVCIRVADQLQTTALDPGSYTYHLAWMEAPGAEPRKASAQFRIVELPAGPASASADAVAPADASEYEH